MTFHGQTRADNDTFDHAHEGPWTIKLSLLLLAVGAVFAGWFYKGSFIGDGRFTFWNGSLVTSAGDVMDQAHHVPAAVIWSPFVAMVLGFGLAWYFYMRGSDIAKRTAETWDGLYAFLLNKWYFDELYNLIFVRPAFWLGRVFWKRGDEDTIDGFGPNGVSGLVAGVAARVRKLQTGYVYHYAFAMIIGLAIAVTWFMAQSGAH